MACSGRFQHYPLPEQNVACQWYCLLQLEILGHAFETPGSAVQGIVTGRCIQTYQTYLLGREEEHLDAVEAFPTVAITLVLVLS